jgi:mannose-6-phosphate isomerase-like protein (cupin superfamily)
MRRGLGGSAPWGEYEGFTTWLLIGQTSGGAREVSVQIIRVAPGGARFPHFHPPGTMLLYFPGRGLVTIGGEHREVCAGEAARIPRGASLGIQNTGPEPLVYLTANTVFGKEQVARIRPLCPTTPPERESL